MNRRSIMKILKYSEHHNYDSNSNKRINKRIFKAHCDLDIAYFLILKYVQHSMKIDFLFLKMLMQVFYFVLH